jgi:two-component system, cell cycle sensor histidine kinase and response regulator CckA
VGTRLKAKLVAPDRPARILIVDDEPNNVKLLQAMLAPDGFLIQTAASGEEALARVKAEPPDLILLDMVMPGLNGLEVTKQLKGSILTRNVPIIIVTARSDQEAMLLGLTAGAEDVLASPVDRAELHMRVRNLLRLKAHGDYHDTYSQLLEGEVTARSLALVDSERLYRSTFEAAPVGIVHLDEHGQWLRVNQRLCDLLGYSAEELKSADVHALIHGKEKLPGESDLFRRLVAGELERYVIDEMRYLRRDGSCLWARINASAHRESAGRVPYFIAVFEDITERRTLEARLQQASKMDAIGGLAAGVAHDFNNLLSVILSYTELLTEGLKKHDPMREDLGQISAAATSAVGLTRQLLAFGRQQVLEPKVLDLGEIVAKIAPMLRRVLGEDVELNVVAAAPLGRILVDPGQMEQVLMNLAVNARDAMPRGGKLTIETAQRELDQSFAAERTNLKPGQHVLLAVSDNGSGMDRETQNRVFEPFFTTKESGKGTGLGLATVFGIVQQSGGTISVYSELGSGTTFEMYFPVVSLAPVVLAPSTPPDARRLTGTETILLVEDEERLRILIRGILTRCGYDVLEAQSGGDALLLCEQHPSKIDLLLTDVVMPRMSGRQLADRLLLLRPEMKVLYISGYTDDAVVRHGILEATVAFLHKPITPIPLSRKVRDVLDALPVPIAPDLHTAPHTPE